MDIEIHGFAGYEILGSGGGRKLERFGDILLDRPAPEAIWPIDRTAPWDNARAVFRRKEGGAGSWEVASDMLPETWSADLNNLSFEIRPGSFGNVGLFPEHAAHWTWMSDLLRTQKYPEVLNLFAYTGGASMVCANAGARVTHVDAARSVNAWASRNSKISNVPKDSIRFIAEDALKFVKREIRRKRRYRGIVIDPPTFGRGPRSEIWKSERDLYPLVETCRTLIADDPLFVLLTSHSPGLTPSVLRLMLSSFGGNIESGEMLLSGHGPPLPAGIYARWTPR